MATAASALDSIVRLTPEERDARYKPGSIRRVKLKNFLTYDDVEFTPGPRLNVVVGPNGTGKSTILCAICLGLGGQPPLLGRADDARQFIKHEKDRAEIMIELAPLKPGGTVHKIGRIIDRDRGAEGGRGAAASTYYVNGNKSTLKMIKQLVTERYSINIDNLCTFLPQDKVGNFSGFDKQSLLHETEKSLSGSQHLYHDHMKLIELEAEVTSSMTDAQSIADRLKELKVENERLEREKELMEERQSCIERIEILEMKKSWLVFEEKRKETTQLKENRNVLKEERKTAQASLRPIREDCAETEGKVNRATARRSTLETKVKSDRRAFENCLAKAEKFQDENENEMADYASVDAQQRKAEREVEKQREKVADIEAMGSDFPPVADLEQTIKTSQDELKSTKKELDKAKKSVHQISNECRKEAENKAEAMRRLDSIRDEKKLKRDRMFRKFQSVGKAFEWIDENRKMFRRPVWGPVGVEVLPKTQNTAAYLENHVSQNTWKSFVVECKEDYDLLYREIRQKRKIAVNIITINNGRLEPIRRMYSDVKMGVLQQEHGFIGYLDESFNAPDPVMQALVGKHNVDKVLVGKESVQESMDRKGLLDYLSKREDGRPGSIGSCFFYSQGNNSYKCTTNISRYSGQTGQDYIEVGSARILAPGSDPKFKEDLQRKIDSAQEAIERFEPEIARGNEEVEKWQKEGQGTFANIKEAKTALTDYKQYQMKLVNAKDKLSEAEENASEDNVAKKAKIKAKVKKLLENIVSVSEKAAEAHNGCMKSTYMLSGVKMTEDGLTENLRKKMGELQEKEQETAEIENRYKQVDREYNQSKDRLKALQSEAQKKAPLNKWQDRLNAEDLPTDLETLDVALEESQNKVDSITDNPNVTKAYDTRKKEIEDTMAELEGMDEAQDIKKKQLEQTRSTWECALVTLVQQVGKKFSKYMTEVGCAGEIRLFNGQTGETPENVNDDNFRYNFKNWGIEILVKFREASKLQVLSAQTHSGGERSVSTIMYLMGLQNLMVSPFRCVDEINQGLDERNERLVFKRIVQNSTRPPEEGAAPNDHCGQYFLITPKLLPNLTDMENEEVTLLFVFSGANNFDNYLDWDVDEFIKQKRKFLTLTAEESSKKRKASQ